MKNVSISFEGDRAAEMAKKFFTWLVDGGLEDQVTDHLSDLQTTVEISDSDATANTITFSCRNATKR